MVLSEIKILASPHLLENAYSKFLMETVLDNTQVTISPPGENVFEMLGSINGSGKILGAGADNIVSTSAHPCRVVYITRGRLSAAKISPPPTTTGELGLLLPWLVKGKTNKLYEFGYVTMGSKTLLIKEIADKSLHIDLSKMNFNEIAYQIGCCRRIITDDYYGVVFAHAMCVGAAFITPHENLDFKLRDYLSNISGFPNPESFCNRINSLIDMSQLIKFRFMAGINEIVDHKESLMQAFLNAMKANGFKIRPEYDNAIFCNVLAMARITTIIEQSKPYLIGRIGGVEFDAYCSYKAHGFNPKCHKIQTLFKYCGYYDKAVSTAIFEKYIKSYENYYRASTLILVGGDKLASFFKMLNPDNTYFSPVYFRDTEVATVVNQNLLGINTTVKVNYGLLESFRYFKRFWRLLNGQKILIISPFEREIQDQLKIKDKLFTRKGPIDDFSDFKYPEFSKVEYINTFLTTNNYETPHSNLIETFESYKQILHTKDFDVALLTCGVYAYLFADYIHNVMKKSCIHVGGIGQLFFGIKGGRYMTGYFETLMNENWIYPYQTIEKNAQHVPDYDGLLGYFKRKN